MPVEITRGNIVEARTEALVNTVNCVGYMGRGIALQFKRAFPRNFAAYSAACRRGEVEPGRMMIHATGLLDTPRYILNFPTKRHWRGKSRLADINSGLIALVDDVERLGIRSIAVPALGCGLGGLDWEEVRPRIEAAFAKLPQVDVRLYEPAGAPSVATGRAVGEVPRLTPGRATLVALMSKYLDGLMDTSISLLEVHKLMYFMQVAGEPLRLRYAKAIYGPYAENLRQVLARIEGHLVSGYLDGGDAPDKQLELVPGAAQEASVFLADHPETAERFDRVTSLVSGFETAFGLELLASVHWVATQEGARTSEAAVQNLYRWNERKRQFSPMQIRAAWNQLDRLGWLSPNVRPS